MGKVIQKVKLSNFEHPDLALEVNAVINTGATMLTLPQEIIDRLALRKLREGNVRYADGEQLADPYTASSPSTSKVAPANSTPSPKPPARRSSSASLSSNSSTSS